MNSSEKQKKIKEELARQVLIYIDEYKYQDSYLSDRPDIKNDRLDIGVEVTSSLKEEISKKIQLIKREIENNNIDISSYVDLNIQDADSIILDYIGTSNDLIKIYKQKKANMNKEGYKLYRENNLYIDTKIIDKNEMNEFIKYLKDDVKLNEFNFDYIYINIESTENNKILLINLNDFNIQNFELSLEDMKYIVRRTIMNV